MKLLQVFASVAVALGILASQPLCARAAIKRSLQSGPMTSNKTSYMAAIDAGSSGTRIYLFNVSVTANTEPFSDEYPWSFDIVGSFSNKKPLASVKYPRETLEPLIAQVKTLLETLPNGPVRAPEVSIYLGATAGMRMLPPESAASIMTSVDDYLKQSGLYFRPGFARILSGEEEGSFGWLAARYLVARSKRLQGTKFAASDIGALELGGASNQITMPTKADVILESKFVMDIAPFRSEHVYSSSFLYFGASEYQAQLESYLKKSAVKNEQRTQGCSKIVNHPCRPKGYNYTTGDTCFLGTSDPHGCDTLSGQFLGQFLAPSVPCFQASRNVESCTLQGRYIPSAIETEAYVAFGAHFYQWQFFVSPKATNVSSSLQELVRAADQICALDQAGLQDYAHTSGAGDAFLVGHCALAYYIKHLLSDAFHIDSDTSILAVNKLEGRSITWALGLAIYENFNLQVDDLFRVRNATSKSTLDSEAIPFKVGTLRG